MGAMGALTLDALLGSLTRGAPAAAYYLHGDEDLLKDEAVQALIARAVEPGARDFNVDQRAAAELDPATLRVLVDTPPLLAARRVVVLRGVEQLKKTSRVRAELSRYLEAPNPTTVLVLVQGAGEPPDPEWSERAVIAVAAPLAPAALARRSRATMSPPSSGCGRKRRSAAGWPRRSNAGRRPPRGSWSRCSSSRG